MALPSAQLARRLAVRTLRTAPCLRSTTPGLMLAHRRWASSSAGSTPTMSMTPAENIAFLNKQREHRPNSPHLAIYQPQITWYLSILNRMTGVALSVALYGASIAYIAHPLFPSIDSAHFIDLVQSMPGWLKGIVKLPFSVAFTFHTFNGIRHLLWDVGKGITLKGVYRGGYTVIALTAVSSIYLSFFV